MRSRSHRAPLLPILVAALVAGAPMVAQASAPDVPVAPAAPSPPAPAAQPPWSERLQLSGILNGDFRWMRHGDPSVLGSAAASDLYVRILEIGVQSSFLNWVSGTTVLNSEWIGDPLNQGDERVAVDEVHLDIDVPGTPLSLVVGKRAQPFGLFENYLVTDPLTQDAYETKKVGLTLAAGGPRAASLSLTAYKGGELMDHLFQAGVLDTTSVRRPARSVTQVDSWIAAGTITPVTDYLTLFGTFSSEPGGGRRNTTLNAGAIAAFPWHRNLSLDLELMRALERERYRRDLGGGTVEDLGESYLDGVLSVTLAYKFVLRPRTVRGGGTYAGRKAQVREHPFEVAVRRESFDDGGLSSALGVWTLRDRTSLGGRYAFFDDGKIISYVALEWRHSRRRLPVGAAGAIEQRNDEVYARLGLDF